MFASRRNTHRLVLSCSILIVALIASVARGGTLENITALAARDEPTRFDAALALVSSTEAGIDARVSRALERKAFTTSAVARAAAEFVLWKRSGKPMGPPPDEPDVPDILLVSIDTLRPDRLGCYGHERETSPALDDLARRGAVFEHAFSPAPWTLPTHMSIFTSLYPSFHKLDRGGAVGNTRLDDSESTMAEILKGSGYHTAAIVAHPFLDGAWGFARGFDLYRRYASTADEQSDRASAWLEWHRFHARRGLVPPGSFLFLHYIDPHEPYDPPAGDRERFAGSYEGALRSQDPLADMFLNREFETPADYQFVLDLYDGEIRFVDDQLARVLETVRATRREGSTIVIVTSDHGEEFKDHGSMGHKHTLYPEQLRVPLIVVDPRRIAPGQRIDEPVSLLDILPTVLDLVGREPPGSMQGISLVPRLRAEGGAAPEMTAVARDLFAELGPLGFKWERKYYRRAIRSGSYSLIYNYLEDGGVTKELYDWRADPGERRNVYAASKDRREVRELERRLEAFIRQGAEYNPEFRTRNDVEIDDELLEKLRALGYVD